VKKIILLTLLALAGCTTSEMPHICKSSNRKNYKIRTNGEMNGYSVSEDEIVEGRTKDANYNRLLITNGYIEVMTRFAYDCGKSKHSDCYAIHMWEPKPRKNLYSSLTALVGLNSDNDYVDHDIWFKMFPSYEDDINCECSFFYCNVVHIKIKAVKLLNKKEADELLAAHPKMNVFKNC
jgi:hypothetical protein